MNFFLEPLGFSYNILLSFLLICPWTEPNLPQLRIPSKEEKQGLHAEADAETAAAQEMVELSGNLEILLQKKIR